MSKIMCLLLVVSVYAAADATKSPTTQSQPVTSSTSRPMTAAELVGQIPQSLWNWKTDLQWSQLQAAIKQKLVGKSVSLVLAVDSFDSKYVKGECTIKTTPVIRVKARTTQELEAAVAELKPGGTVTITLSVKDAVYDPEYSYHPLGVILTGDAAISKPRGR